MQIKKGSSRIVLVFSSIGIAVKFPKIYLLTLIDLLKDCHKKRNWTLLKREPIFKELLFKPFYRGIFNNWREFYFYLKTRHPFLQPVYFSFVGLVNIQRLGKHCGVSENNFKLQLQKITNKEVEKDGHHFCNPRNFSLERARLKIFDYGSPNTQKIILEYGMKIFNEFDPNWKEKSTHRT